MDRKGKKDKARRRKEARRKDIAVKKGASRYMGFAADEETKEVIEIRVNGKKNTGYELVQLVVRSKGEEERKRMKKRRRRHHV